METPTLTDMGITSPDEISDYSVRSDGPKADILKIFYKRTSLSMRPVRRTYEFGRARRSVLVDSASGTTEEIFEPSPILQAAVKELKSLLGGAGDALDPKEALFNELESIQAAIAKDADATQLEQRLKDMKQLIEKL